MALGPFVQLVPGPEAAACFVAPGCSGGLPGFCTDGLRHHKHELVRLVLGGQAADLFDLRTSVRYVERLYPLALEDDTPIFLPGNDVTPLLAPGFAEMLRVRIALTLHKPQAETLEVERRQLLEGERMRGARQRRLGRGGHGGDL